nr:MAG TPA: hypothetical protein [Caudoviricetes sp.]
MGGIYRKHKNEQIGNVRTGSLTSIKLRQQRNIQRGERRNRRSAWRY